MNPQTTISPPVRCTECAQLMESPIACLTCGAVSHLPPEVFDCFEVFGLPRGYDVDTKALHRKYLTMSRFIHPDLAIGDGPQERSHILHLSSKFNRAYDTLRDPVARAEYLLSLSGGQSSAEDKTVPGDLLGQVLLLREEIDEAVAGDDQATLEALRGQVAASREAVLKRVGELARMLTSGAEGGDTRRRLREQLNTVKYWTNLLEKIPTAGTAEAG